MQLHLAEHRDLMKCLHKAGVAAGVRLVKRKGWVFINIQGKSFAFHRKKVTRLENGTFTDSHEYYVNYPQAPVKVEGWQQVVERLEEWLVA